MPVLVNWTDERAERLRLLRSQGVPPTRIAKELGLSRNAVFAKIDQLRLPLVTPQPAAGAPAPSESVTAPKKAAEPTSPQAIRLEDQAMPDEEPSAEPGAGVTIQDLRADHCRRPLWGDHSRTPLRLQFYCAAPVLPGKSWCSACLERIVDRQSPLKRVDALLRKAAA